MRDIFQRRISEGEFRNKYLLQLNIAHLKNLDELKRSAALPSHSAQRQGRPIPESVLSTADPKQRSEVWFLLACTSKTTHKGSGPKSRTNLPAPGPRPRLVDVDSPV